MGLSGRDCPDCGRRVREPFEKTITGREVCPDCANALFLGSAAGAVNGGAGSGYGVWAMLVRKVRRSG
ncbi:MULTISPECIES: hypothetical protein [Catenuloplanes]|uniref:Ribosomal protein S27AE n=1 Tax=Catenuloplanes niger TaxID=587534 RepID=A0AAE3ZYL0_9ACTN|nr:hypothetical protein [Catenuloplanes niger]MDR7327332.1 ribosomal protein S27AE [Catenuloplanes niger]